MFVHGCYASTRLAESLDRTVNDICQKIKLRRIHIWSYDTASLLREGEPRLRKLSSRLATDIIGLVNKDSPNVVFVLVTHNSAIWVTQQAISELQYHPNSVRLPVGVIAVGLPDARPQNLLLQEHWNSYSERLLLHLKSDKQQPMLQYETVKRVMSEFKDLRKEVEREGTKLLFHEVVHEPTKVASQSVANRLTMTKDRTGFSKRLPRVVQSLDKE